MKWTASCSLPSGVVFISRARARVCVLGAGWGGGGGAWASVVAFMV